MSNRIDFVVGQEYELHDPCGMVIHKGVYTCVVCPLVSRDGSVPTADTEQPLHIFQIADEIYTGLCGVNRIDIGWWLQSVEIRLVITHYGKTIDTMRYYIPKTEITGYRVLSFSHNGKQGE